MGPGFPRHLTRRFIGDGAFAEDGRDAFFLHGVDNLAHLLRGALLVGIDRPQIQFAQAIVAGQIGEGSLAGDQPALIRRQLRQSGLQRRHRLTDLLFVGLGVTAIGVGVRRIVLHQRIANVIDIDQGVICRHPGMGIGLPAIGARADAHRLDPLADHHLRNAL